MLHSVDLKRNTISQSKCPASIMSPALQHTPVQGTSSKQISDTDMEIYIREEIDKIINLDQLYTVTAKFLEKDEY